MIEIFYVLVILLGFTYPKLRLIGYLQILIIFLCLILNYNNADYKNYENTYNSITDGGLYFQYFQNYEIGYKLVAILFDSISADFLLFYVFLRFVALILLYKSFRIIVPNFANAAFSCYLIFPFLLDLLQIRNFVGMSISQTL